MNIKIQLLKLLVEIPNARSIGERRALLTMTGFDYLNTRINEIQSNNFAFFNELIELVLSEGHDKLLEFIGTLVDSEFIGLEVKQKLNALITEISSLETQQWNSKFVECKNPQPISIIPVISQSAEIREEEKDTQLPVPSIPGTQPFEFTVRIVNAQGKEVKRRQRQNYYLAETFDNGITLEMVYIPGGEFLMGSPESEGKRYSNERPQHKVTIRSFLMSKYPITQAQWREVASLPEISQTLKLRPSRNGGKSHPITHVSWFDAVEFCDRLSQKTDKVYRLPTEAEWEYACRAKTTTSFHFGQSISSDLANYDPYGSEPRGINRKATIAVDSLQVANGFGLFDMHGNVWEWCLDHWHDNYNNAPTTGDVWLNNHEAQTRVIRGGSWLNDPSMCRSASRLYKNADELLKHISFRIVCPL